MCVLSFYAVLHSLQNTMKRMWTCVAFVFITYNCVLKSHSHFKKTDDSEEEIELDDDDEEEEEEIMPKKTRAALPSNQTPATSPTKGILSHAHTSIDYNFFK